MKKEIEKLQLQLAIDYEMAFCKELLMMIDTELSTTDPNTDYSNELLDERNNIKYKMELNYEIEQDNNPPNDYDRLEQEQKYFNV